MEIWVEWDVIEEEIVLDLIVEVGRCVDLVGEIEEVVMEEEVVGVVEVDKIEDEVGVMEEEVEGVDVEETEEEVGVVSVKVEVKIEV